MSDKKENRMPITKSVNPAPNRGLGRGLSSLLGDVGVAAAAGIAVPKSNAPVPDRLLGLREIPVEWINTGPWQPRRVFARMLSTNWLAPSARRGLSNQF